MQIKSSGESFHFIITLHDKNLQLLTFSGEYEWNVMTGPNRVFENIMISVEFY